MYHYDRFLKLQPEWRTILEAVQTVHRERPQSVEAFSAMLEERMGVMTSVSIVTAIMALHDLQGQQTFRVGPRLSEMFQQTSLEAVPKEALKLPFSVFYVDLPDSGLRIWGGTRTRWHEVKGLYVSHSFPEAALFENVDAGAEMLNISLHAEANEHSVNAADDATTWARLFLHECDDDLEKAIADMLERSNMVNDPLPEMHIEEGAVHEGEVVDDVVGETITKAFRIAINLALYLQTEEAETETLPDDARRGLEERLRRAKSDGKRKKIQRRLDKLSCATTTVIAPTLEHQLQSQHRRVTSSMRTHWVRGHWRTYWVGKGRTKKTRKWLLPFLRGDGEEPQPHTYKVQEEAPSS